MNDYEYSIEHIEYMQEQRFEDWHAYELMAKLFELALFGNIFIMQYFGI